MVNYSRFIGRAMDLMQKPSMIESPSGRVPEKVPRWDLTGTEGCGGGKVFSWLPLMVLGYKSIYGQKNQVRRVKGPTRVGARPTPWARPPSLWPPRGSSDFISKSPGCLLVQEKSSRRFHSVWTRFGIPFLRNSKTREKTETGTGLQVNRLVPKIIQNSILMHIKHPKQII